MEHLLARQKCIHVGQADDEYYTLPLDVGRIMSAVPLVKLREGRGVLCPCDDSGSEFVRWCAWHHVPCTHTLDFASEDPSGFGYVATNPPFSLLTRGFLDWLLMAKDFSVVIPEVALNYEGLWHNVASGLWGVQDIRIRDFIRPDGTVRQVSCVVLCGHHVRHYQRPRIREIDARCTMTDEGILNVPQVKLIPSGYRGRLAVPITFLKSYNGPDDEYRIVENKHNLHIRGKQLFTRFILEPWYDLEDPKEVA